MKIIHYSIFRALCAIAVGALLVKYRSEAVVLMTQVIGGFFILFGLVACIKPKALRNKTDDTDMGMEQTENKTMSLIQGGARGCAAVGSILLGCVLVFMPSTFVHFLIYILSAFLIIGAVQQFVTLGVARHNAPVGLGYWIMPLLLFIVGIIALFRPEIIAEAPLYFIGWAMMIYGVVECINAIKARSNRKKAEEAFFSLNHKPDFSNAEEVEAEEVR